MSSKETDGIYKKLLRIYARRYQKPEWVLNHYIDGLVKEGKTREGAIVHLYQKEARDKASSVEIDETYKKLLIEYSMKGLTNAEAVLENTIKTFVDEGRTREQAIHEIWEKEMARMPSRHEIEQSIEHSREKIDRLAVLFSQGEISEESYKSSVKAIEENIDEVRRGNEIPKVSASRPPSITSRYESEWVRGEPTQLWWLVPFFFGIIGGIVAYVGVRSDDEDMAFNLLMFGIVWTVILSIIGYAAFFRFIFG